MVQIRIKKTLSEGLLYVIICSKEINKPEFVRMMQNEL